MTSKRIARIAVFVLLIIVGGKIVIPFAIPMTLQTFFVISAGFVLGGKDGFIACLIYTILGLMGLPVYAEDGEIFEKLDFFIRKNVHLVCIFEYHQCFKKKFFAPCAEVCIVIYSVKKP